MMFKNVIFYVNTKYLIIYAPAALPDSKVGGAIMCQVFRLLLQPL